MQARHALQIKSNASNPRLLLINTPPPAFAELGQNKSFELGLFETHEFLETEFQIIERKKVSVPNSETD